MGFNAEAACDKIEASLDKLESLIKSLTTRVTNLETALKSQAEAKISSKMEALEKSIAALKAADERDFDTVKKLEEATAKQLQALEASLKKKIEAEAGADASTLAELQRKNEQRIAGLQKEALASPTLDEKTLDKFFETKRAKWLAEDKARKDAEDREREEWKKQVIELDKKALATVKHLQADSDKKLQEAVAKFEKQLEKQMDITYLEARLKPLEALVNQALAKG